jgi:hypothetical protein
LRADKEALAAQCADAGALVERERTALSAQLASEAEKAQQASAAPMVLCCNVVRRCKIVRCFATSVCLHCPTVRCGANVALYYDVVR